MTAPESRCSGSATKARSAASASARGRPPSRRSTLAATPTKRWVAARSNTAGPGWPAGPWRQHQGHQAQHQQRELQATASAAGSAAARGRTASTSSSACIEGQQWAGGVRREPATQRLIEPGRQDDEHPAGRVGGPARIAEAIRLVLPRYGRWPYEPLVERHAEAVLRPEP